MRFTGRLAVGAAALFGAALLASGTQAETVGVTDTEIKIGHTNPYSGPASAYGTIGKTIIAYINMLNEQGGINGRKINFISLDDGYSPPKTKEQFRKLVEQEEVAAIFQSLGTPTNSAVHEYMNRKKVPHLFVATGATKWGDPENFPWTLGWQPNYQTAGKIFGRYILDNAPDGKIGILYQNDDYGKDYITGLQLALGDRFEKMVIAQESYEVADPTVDSQVVNLKAKGADVFYNITTPKFAAQAIKKAYEIGWKPLHVLNDVSNSVGSVLKPAGFEASKGIVSAVYLKDPTDPAWKDDPEYKEWVAWMDQYFPEGDKTSSFTVFGYAAAQTLEHVLKQAGNDLSRENIMAQAANIKDLRLKMALPGIMVNTGPNDYFPIEQMQMEQFDGKEWVRFGPILSADAGS
jgi:ABC-type branched-subunit amino acid transport system substrate-binding protein